LYSVLFISLQEQYIAMLHSSIGTGIGYWYRYRPVLLDIGCLVRYRSNPNWVRAVVSTVTLGVCLPQASAM